MSPFFITGLPRSRTAWLANWLTTDQSHCWHDGLLHAKSLEDYCHKLQSKLPIGDASCGIGLIWKVVLNRFPKSKWLLVQRDPNMSFLSFRIAFGAMEAEDVSRRKFSVLQEQLTDLTIRLKPRVVQFKDLDDDEVCRDLWCWLLPEVRFDTDRLRLLQGLKIEQFAAKHRSAVEAARANPWYSELANKCCPALTAQAS